MCQKYGIIVIGDVKEIIDRHVHQESTYIILYCSNCKEEHLSVIRDGLINELKISGGELKEIPYTYNEEVQKVDLQAKERLSMPEFRSHQSFNKHIFLRPFFW